MKVKYCKYGLSNYYPDHIEINQHLKKHKTLRNIIIKHELGHSERFDVKHDFDIPLGLMVIPFIIKHPSTWIDFLPIQRKDNEWVYDLNIIILYSICITGLGILLKIIL